MIRHKNDFGAAILLDSRYGWGKNRNGVSSWMRKEIFSCENDKQSLEMLKTFYEKAKDYTRKQIAETMSLQAIAQGKDAEVIDLKRTNPSEMKMNQTESSDDIEDEERSNSDSDGVTVSIGTKMTVDNDSNVKISKSSNMATANFGMTVDDILNSDLKLLLETDEKVHNIDKTND